MRQWDMIKVMIINKVRFIRIEIEERRIQKSRVIEKRVEKKRKINRGWKKRVERISS